MSKEVVAKLIAKDADATKILYNFAKDSLTIDELDGYFRNKILGVVIEDLKNWGIDIDFKGIDGWLSKKYSLNFNQQDVKILDRRLAERELIGLSEEHPNWDYYKVIHLWLSQNKDWVLMQQEAYMSEYEHCVLREGNTLHYVKIFSNNVKGDMDFTVISRSYDIKDFLTFYLDDSYKEICVINALMPKEV